MEADWGKRYTVYNARRKGPGKAFIDFVAPPTAVFDCAFDDISAIVGDGEYKGSMLQGTPLGLISGAISEDLTRLAFAINLQFTSSLSYEQFWSGWGHPQKRGKTCFFVTKTFKKRC